MYIICITYPNKRRLVTSQVCFGSEKAGLLDHSYNKCAYIYWKYYNHKCNNNSESSIADQSNHRKKYLSGATVD